MKDTFHWHIYIYCRLNDSLLIFYLSVLKLRLCFLSPNWLVILFVFLFFLYPDPAVKKFSSLFPARSKNHLSCAGPARWKNHPSFAGPQARLGTGQTRDHRDLQSRVNQPRLKSKVFIEWSMVCNFWKSLQYSTCIVAKSN